MDSEVIVIEEEANGEDVVVKVDQSYVGVLILTKGIGQDTWMDITYTYKYPSGEAEGSGVVGFSLSQGHGNHSNQGGGWTCTPKDQKKTALVHLFVLQVKVQAFLFVSLVMHSILQ